MQRGRKLSFNALKSMEGMPVLVHDLEYDTYDQLCIVEFSYIPVTPKTMKYFLPPKVKKKGKKKDSQQNKAPIGVRYIELVNDDFKFTYDFLGRCLHGEFECYAPKEDDKQC